MLGFRALVGFFFRLIHCASEEKPLTLPCARQSKLLASKLDLLSVEACLDSLLSEGEKNPFLPSLGTANRACERRREELMTGRGKINCGTHRGQEEEVEEEVEERI